MASRTRGHADRVVAESTFAVMTRDAVVARGDIMLFGNYVRHLPPLRSTSTDGMTFIAADALTRAVIGMAECRFENVPRLRGAAVRRKLVTDRT